MASESVVFDHVHLISEDPKSAATWYEEKLGGKIVATQDVRGAPQVVVGFQGATVLIRGVRPGELAAKKEGQQIGTDHFGFRVGGDFDGFCRELRKKGVKFTMEPVDFSPTVRIAFIEAPDGVSIEVLQRKA